MKSKKIVIIFFLVLKVVYSYGQIDQDSVSNKQEVKNYIEKKTEVQQMEVPVYKLYPTDNYWTFLKLDTRNGRIWQVHFTIDDGYEGELPLNLRALINDGKIINGRFNLYPSKNMYNFILLDQLTGKTYQVQWNNEKNKRFISPLN
jgi:hypothetical protein